MPDHPLLVALLTEYALEESITRPEVAKIVGKTPGQIAGIWHRNELGSWPKLDPTRRANRRCQFPLGIPGTDSFHLCGKVRNRHPRCCDEHKDKKWSPEEATEE